MPEFEAIVQWDKGGRVCKMTQMKKDGKTFFIGNLGNNLKLTLHKINGEFGQDKKGNPLWNLSFVPVIHKKVEPTKANDLETSPIEDVMEF